MNTLYDVALGRKLPFRQFEPYIMSFCGHPEPYELENGLLSQWRAYGRELGYALVFDCKGLSDALTEEHRRFFYSSAYLSSVIYDGDEQRFAEKTSKFINLIDQTIEKSSEVGWTRLLSFLLENISRYKHHGFREEQEVRLVTSPMSQAFIDHMIKEDQNFTAKHAGKEIKRREFRANLASYVSLCGDKELLPITKIIIGPHANQEIWRKRLERYLEIKCFKIPVTCSQTPLLGKF